jgi:hypothetical protein
VWTVTDPEIIRFGLGDLYVQPLKLGWRVSRFDLVTGYGFYAPTGMATLEGFGDIGRGHWTHEFSLGGTVAFDPGRTWLLSALASFDLNGRKRHVDITRGPTIQVQGGLGKTLLRIVDVGLAGYAQWQVADDRGADLPPVLRGGRDRSFGLGPEVGVIIPPIRSRLSARYEWDLAVRSRPKGRILVVGLTLAAWRPAR